MTSTGSKSREAYLSELAGRRTPYREIIDRFGLVLSRQADLRSELPMADDTAPRVDEERFLSGAPLVSFVPALAFKPAFLQAASRIWPVLGDVFPPLVESLSGLSSMLEEDEEWVELCLRAVVHGEADALDMAAAKSDVTPAFLLMALRAAYGPCIAARKDSLLARVQAALWRKPHCPVCGSDADLGVLECHPAPSDYLISKSGEVWHHCPVCTHRWRFVRLICPGCGNQDHKSLTRFSSPDSLFEHFQACEKCLQYLPGLDLTENSRYVDHDLAALGLVHLDAVAQSRGYVPLSPAPWTALAFEAASR